MPDWNQPAALQGAATPIQELGARLEKVPHEATMTERVMQLTQRLNQFEKEAAEEVGMLKQRVSELERKIG